MLPLNRVKTICNNLVLFIAVQFYISDQRRTDAEIGRSGKGG